MKDLECPPLTPCRFTSASQPRLVFLGRAVGRTKRRAAGTKRGRGPRLFLWFVSNAKERSCPTTPRRHIEHARHEPRGHAGGRRQHRSDRQRRGDGGGSGDRSARPSPTWPWSPPFFTPSVRASSPTLPVEPAALRCAQCSSGSGNTQRKRLPCTLSFDP
jgi:hypothetical protein